MANVTADVVQSWQDTAVKTGNTYTYRIRASYVCTGKKTVYGTASTAVSAKTELAKQVQWLRLSGPDNTVSWGKVSGASGYRVYRRSSRGTAGRGSLNRENNVSSYQDSRRSGESRLTRILYVHNVT